MEDYEEQALKELSKLPVEDQTLYTDACSDLFALSAKCPKLKLLLANIFYDPFVAKERLKKD